MYEQYWGLREKPFRKTPDPRYLFLNEAYEEALERLEFAVEEMELALLTGEVGSGKTLLTRALVDRVGERYEVGMILNPRLSPRQFLRTTAAELGVREPRFHSSDLLDQIAVLGLPPDSEVLGPLPYEPPRHRGSGPLATAESPQVRALVSVNRSDGKALTAVLRTAVSVRSARKAGASLSVRMDPVVLA